MRRIIFFIIAIISTTLFAYTNDDTKAKDDAQVYYITDQLDLATTMKLQYGKKPKTFIKSVYPQLEGSENIHGITYFNRLVMDILQQEITAFTNNAIQNQKYLSKNTPTKSMRNSLYIDYAASVIKSKKDHIISIRFNIQGYLAGMAHPYHYHKTLNFDVEKGEPLELADLFEPNSDYLTLFANYADETLKKRLPNNEEMIAEGTQPKADNYKNWNIQPNGILITFDEYKVAPYVYGAQTVLIPFSSLTDVLATESPLTHCIKNKNTCRRNNLLTGGFIDAVNTTHGSFNPVLG